MSYTTSEWRSIEPLARKAVEQAREHPERRDLFLCHAWDDREGSASDLYDRLKSNGATVWFSEKDVALGKQLIREIDKGLRTSRVGIVLVTPALLKSIEAEGIAEKELSVLLASGRVIPVTHGTTLRPCGMSAPCSPRTLDWTPHIRRWTMSPQRSPPPPRRSPRTAADARRPVHCGARTPRRHLVTPVGRPSQGKRTSPRLWLRGVQLRKGRCADNDRRSCEHAEIRSKPSQDESEPSEADRVGFAEVRADRAAVPAARELLAGGSGIADMRFHCASVLGSPGDKCFLDE